MDFYELINKRQSCRSYDTERDVEDEKIDWILKCARLAPSACNSQPYSITVCKGENAKKIASETQGMGRNKFTSEAPVMIVISEGDYKPMASTGSKVMKNDYRSMDIGILASYITLEAKELGLDTCMIGWFDDKKVRKICGINRKVRLIITLGYAKETDKLRKKVRKELGEFVKTV